VDRWGLLSFVVLALVAAALWRPRTRVLGAYYATAVLLVLASIVVAYWITPTGLGFQLGATSRTMNLVGFVGVVAALHLAAGLFEEEDEPEPVAGELSARSA